jgi:hypothetical protein
VRLKSLQQPLVIRYRARLRVFRRLVLEEEVNTRRNVADFLRLRFSLAGKLIFKASLR